MRARAEYVSPASLRRRGVALVGGLVLAGLGGPSCGSAPPPVPARVTASVPAPVTHEACAPSAVPDPLSVEDVTWARAVVDRWLAGASVRELVCVIGQDLTPSGSDALIAPRSANFERARVILLDKGSPSLVVVFRKDARPRVASVERAFAEGNPAKETSRVGDRIAAGTMEQRHAQVVLDTLAPDDPTRLASLWIHLHPPAVPTRGDWKCVNSANIEVRMTSRPINLWDVDDRLTPGRWTFDVIDATSGAAAGQYRCVVPVDILEPGRCDPPGEEGSMNPGTRINWVGTDITLNVPGTFAAGSAHRYDIDVGRDGAPLGRWHVVDQNRAGATELRDWKSGDCYYDSGVIRLDTR